MSITRLDEMSSQKREKLLIIPPKIKGAKNTKNTAIRRELCIIHEYFVVFIITKKKKMEEEEENNFDNTTKNDATTTFLEEEDIR